jgi:hypothetical protein
MQHSNESNFAYGWRRLICQSDHFAGAFVAHQVEHVQVNRVGAWLEFGRINAQHGQGLGPDSHAKFSILSAFGFIGGLAVVVNADK